jgi:hypothetical protein
MPGRSGASANPDARPSPTLALMVARRLESRATQDRRRESVPRSVFILRHNRAGYRLRSGGLRSPSWIRGGCPLAMNSPSSRHTAATCGFGGRARRAFIGRHKREGHHLPYCAVVARAAPPDVTVDRTSHTRKSRAAHARPQDARAGAPGNARRQSYPVISGGVIVSIVHTHHSYPGMPGRAIASLLAGHRRRCHRGNCTYTAL